MSKNEPSWAKLESEVAEWLNSKVSDSNVSFQQCGGSNSTVSDIQIMTNNKFTGRFIEVKSANAQAGQFVLFPNMTTRTFEYSTKNHSDYNNPVNSLVVSEILDFMDENFDSYANAGTKGKEIVFPKLSAEDNSRFFALWISDYYSNVKHAEWLATKDSNNNIILLPFSKLAEYFDVTACYRVKKSGSSSVKNSCKTLETVKQAIISLNPDNVPEFTIVDNKLYAKFETIPQKLGNVDYHLAIKGEWRTLFEVRKLSKTFNSNVIFSLKLKQLSNEQIEATKEYLSQLV